ncbi:sensor histidine kinase [Temperatibacter marinus]|uniref:histidine kinase n=1 Tax=Temperatibacter marinus TaxID=1456591 RepID=A0AA52EF71_9PROT|nr:sensor histidine kinase [Temperatibacter marinus]WND01422.1 sensor histidine kinase [Temperatibacter marinus]
MARFVVLCVWMIYSLGGTYSSAFAEGVRDPDLYCYKNSVKPLNEFITYSRSKRAAPSFEDVLSGTVALRPMDRDAIHFGTTNDVFWFHLSLENCEARAEDYMLLTHNVRLAELVIYKTTNPEKSILFDTNTKGATVAILKKYGTIATPFSLGAGEKVDFYFKVKAHNAMSFPVEIQYENEFAYRQGKEKAILSAIIAAIISLIAFNALMFVFTRMQVFSFYVLIELASLGYLLHHIGWTTANLWGDGPFDHLGAGLLSVLATMMIVQFNRYYFETRKKALLLDRVLRFFVWAMGLWCVAKILTMFGDFIAPVVLNYYAYIFAYPSFFVVLGAAVYFSFWKRQKTTLNKIASYLILTAWVVLVGNIMIIGLRANSILPDAGVSPAIEFGYAVLIEAVLVSLALAIRIKTLYNEREKLSVQSLELIRREQKLLTERELANQSAIETGKLILSVGHDSQQMLAAIRNYSDILIRDKNLEKVKVIGQAMKDSSLILMDILRNAMNAGDRRSIALEVQPEEFDARSTFDALNLIYKQIVRENNNQLSFKGADVVLKTDRVVLMRIIGNFISNATKYTQDGKILVTCRKRKNAIALEVWDTGCGMSENELKSFLNATFKLRSVADQEKYKGTGVGLQVCLELAEKIDGDIQFFSQQNKGTRAVLLIPAKHNVERLG